MISIEGETIQGKTGEQPPQPVETEGTPAVLASHPFIYRSGIPGLPEAMNNSAPGTRGEEGSDQDLFQALVTETRELRDQKARLEAEIRDLRNANGQPPTTVLPLQADSQQLVKDALVAQKEELSGIVRTVAHDLRNPLGSVLGYAQLARKELGRNPVNQDKLAHFLESIQGSALKMAIQIDDIVSGDVPLEQLHKKPRLVADIIAEASQGTATSREKENVLLVIEPPDPTLQILADITLPSILKIFMENAVYAMKRTKQGSRILTITVKKADNNITVYTADTGTGIHKEFQEKIFKGHSSKKRSGKGSGFGLGKAQAIALKHGGQVWLERNVTAEMLQEDPSLEHTGATFALSLPLC